MKTANTRAVLLIAPVIDTLLERLSSAYEVYRLYEQQDVAGFLEKHGAEIRAVVTRGTSA